jgi:hypothetical protein
MVLVSNAGARGSSIAARGFGSNPTSIAVMFKAMRLIAVVPLPTDLAKLNLHDAL